MVRWILFLVLFSGEAIAQKATTDSAYTDLLALRPIQVGVDLLYGWRSNGEHGLGLMASYRTPIGSLDFEGNLFQRYFSGSDTATFSFGRFGFGFGLGIIVPQLIKISRSVIEPRFGVSFTVWNNTLGIGLPTGAEVHIPIVSIMDASFGAIVEPEFNLNAVQNTIIYDLRLGVRFH
ncbi:MAG TPA: hypothetical protein VFO76_04070 [Candidatus Kapabacteria bacterium]|nr:hypothetical protein [Candidatus Kapabacteria bacterium]